MRLLSKLILAFTLSAAFSAAIAFEPPRISLVNTRQDLVHFEVAGIWPDTCPPQLLEVSAQGRDILLLATRETEGCRATPTPYAFSSTAQARERLFSEDGIHRVRLEVESALESGLMLAGFALVRNGETPPTLALESGFWWAEQGGQFSAGPGLGLSVETQGGMISLSVMGYGERGDSAWYFGAGELNEGIAHLDLGQFEGGAGPFARYAAPDAISLTGFVDVETLTPSRAILWFSQADSGSGKIHLRPLSIMRFNFAQEPGEALLGRWLIAGTETDARPTRWVDWVRSEAFDGGFVLHDAEGSITLRCDTPSHQPGSPPAICRMESVDGEVIEFTDVAFRRLSGWDADARRIVAFRLD